MSPSAPTEPSSCPATILALLHSSALVVAQSQNVVQVVGEKWWITASVAVISALLGSFAGAGATYRASVALESRRRKNLSEIRRRAKVYTPIRAELVALQRAVAENRHLFYGVLRDRDSPNAQTQGRSPVLAVWRELVEDGRANTSASARVRTVLNRVEVCADSFNEAVVAARATFKERGDAIAQQSGGSPRLGNWQWSEFEALVRDGIRGSRMFTNTFTQGPGALAPATLPAEQEEYVRLWEADEAVSEARTRVADAEKALIDAVRAAIADLDAAIKHVADKYEHEPD
jgi:hypothetical protein